MENILSNNPSPDNRPDHARPYTERRLEQRPGARAYPFTLVYRGPTNPESEAIIAATCGITVIDLEADQALCSRIRSQPSGSWQMRCGCSENQPAFFALRAIDRSQPAPLDDEPATIGSSKYYLPVCVLGTACHAPDCLFHKHSEPGKPAHVVDANGMESVMVSAALQGNDRDEQSDEVEESRLTLPRTEGATRQGKWGLRRLIILAYLIGSLNKGPKRGNDQIKQGFYALWGALRRIKIMNENRPPEAENFAIVTLIPEIHFNAVSMIRRRIAEGARPIVVGRFQNPRPTEDGKDVRLQMVGAEGVAFVVSRRHFEKRLGSYRDPAHYAEAGFSSVMYFNAADNGDGKIRMVNLGWIHVTEQNIPIESCEEGYVMRQFMAYGLPFEKILHIENDKVTGAELPRRDIRLLKTKIGVVDVEVFGMSLASYQQKLPTRTKETGHPLLCILYLNGKELRRYWADPEREREYPGGALPLD